MKVLLICLSLIFSKVANGQISSTLVDKKTKAPIPFASVLVKGKLHGTSTELNGNFILETERPDSLIISSVGYNTLIISCQDVEDTTLLNPQILQLEEVEAKPKNRFNFFKEKNTLGGVSNFYFANSYWVGTAGHPYEIARFFKYEPEISSTRILKSVTFVTDSKVDGAVFLVKFYKKGANGLPGELINKNKIVATAKKGSHKTEVNLKEDFIYFPKEGMFVGVEFLIIEQNKVKRSTSFTFEGKLYEHNYEPSFSTQQVEEHPFNYTKDVKKQLWTKVSSSEGLKLRNNPLECKLVLIE